MALNTQRSSASCGTPIVSTTSLRSNSTSSSVAHTIHWWIGTSTLITRVSPLSITGSDHRTFTSFSRAQILQLSAGLHSNAYPPLIPVLTFLRWIERSYKPFPCGNDSLEAYYLRSPILHFPPYSMRYFSFERRRTIDGIWAGSSRMHDFSLTSPMKV